MLLATGVALDILAIVALCHPFGIHSAAAYGILSGGTLLALGGILQQVLTNKIRSQIEAETIFKEAIEKWRNKESPPAWTAHKNTLEAYLYEDIPNRLDTQPPSAWTAYDNILRAYLNKDSELDLQNCQLTTLPPEIGSLSNLRTLYLHGNVIDRIPDQILNRSPKILILMDKDQINRLDNKEKERIESDMQDHLQSWSNTQGKHGQLAMSRILTSYITQDSNLDLSNLQLTELPQTILYCSSLTNLQLQGNQLRSVAGLKYLQQLQYLNLSKNLLSSLPEDIKNLHDLRELNLTDNSLSSLPEDIDSLQQLTILQLDHNKLKDLPPAICTLTHLQKLSLANNSLSSLPEDIKNLHDLRELNLTDNHFSRWPEALQSLSGLQTLSLSENSLSMIPPEINKLQSLEKLYLTKNQELTELPEEILLLKNLYELDLENSPIASLPSLPNTIQIKPDNLKEIPAQAIAELAQSMEHWTNDINIDLYETLTSGKNKVISAWLNHLRTTKTYQEESLRQDFTNVVVSLVSDLRDPEFRDLFFSAVIGNTESCGYRASATFNQLFTSWKAWQLSHRPDPEISKNVDTLIRIARTEALEKALAQLTQQTLDSRKILGYLEVDPKDKNQILEYKEFTELLLGYQEILSNQQAHLATYLHNSLHLKFIKEFESIYQQLLDRQRKQQAHSGPSRTLLPEIDNISHYLLTQIDENFTEILFTHESLAKQIAMSDPAFASTYPQYETTVKQRYVDKMYLIYTRAEYHKLHTKHQLFLMIPKNSLTPAQQQELNQLHEDIKAYKEDYDKDRAQLETLERSMGIQADVIPTEPEISVPLSENEYLVQSDQMMGSCNNDLKEPLKKWWELKIYEWGNAPNASPIS